MIVDKKEFKELKNQGGGAKGCKLTITAYHEFGLNSIKENECGSLSIMNNGIFYDITFGKKFFIPLEKITGTTIENNRLVITTDIKEESKIVFRTGFVNSILKMQNIIAETIGVAIVTKDEASRQEREEKEKFIAERKAIREKNKEEALAKYQEEIAKRKQEKICEQERLEQLDKNHIPYCPKCHSTSITYVEHRKKLSLGRAVVGGAIGGVLTGGLGAAAGAAMGGLSSKKVKGEVKCLNCGYTWKL